MNKTNIKKAIRESFGNMYDIVNVTVGIEQDPFNAHYENVVAVIIEKDMSIIKLYFNSYYKTCYKYIYVADEVLTNEYEWMYERFAHNLEIIERR